VAIGYLILAAGCWVGLRGWSGAPSWPWPYASFSYPAYHFVVLTHLHHLVPLMQTMHYVVWVGFLPRYAPGAAAAFDARVPWLRGR
jgi:hypothetical protein